MAVIFPVAVCAVILCLAFLPQAFSVAKIVFSAAAPLLLGSMIAFVINIPMSALECHFPQGKLMGKVRRPVCMFISVLFLCAIIAAVGILVIPKLLSAITVFAQQLPTVVEAFLNDPTLGGILPEEIAAAAESIDWESAFETAISYLENGLAGASVSAVSSLVSGAATVVFAVIFSLYFLTEKEKLAGRSKQAASAICGNARAQRFFHILSVANDCFHKYIVGQFTEAIILGALCAIGMLILQIPYAAMVGALVGITALIPVAGAYVGAAVGFVILLPVSMPKAIIFLVLLVALQLVEGNLIYPRIVGSSVSLPGVWILASVTVFSAIAGVPGVLLGVPIAATVYRLVQERVEEKGSLPEADSLTCKK